MGAWGGGDEGFQFLSYEHAFKSSLKVRKGGKKPLLSYKSPNSNIILSHLLGPLSMAHQPGRGGDIAIPPNTDSLNMAHPLRDILSGIPSSPPPQTQTLERCSLCFPCCPWSAQNTLISYFCSEVFLRRVHTQVLTHTRDVEWLPPRGG